MSDEFVDARSDADSAEDNEFVDAQSSWTTQFPLHAACWANDVEFIEKFMKRRDTRDVNALDACGHAAIHVAALRRAIGAIGALVRHDSVDLELRDARGWTATRLAARRRARGCVRTLVEAKRSRKTREMKSGTLGRELGGALREVGDFETRVSWRFGSAVLAPLVKMVTPRDTYDVTVCGSKMRIDGELRGIDSDVMGKSVIPKWRKGRFSLIFDGARGAESKLWFVDHESREVVDATAKPNEGAQVKVADDTVSSTGTPPALTEDEIVDAITDELLAEGAKKRRVRWEDLAFAPARGWISKRASAWIKGRKTEIWEASAKVVRETIAPGEGVCLDGTYEEYADRASEWGENIVKRKPLGAPSNDESGLNEFDDEAKKLEREKREKRQKSRKMTARCWLVRDFPLKAAHASRILDVLSRANKHAERVNRVVKYWSDNHKDMFPMKMQVPLMFTVYAQVHFKDFRALDEKAKAAKISQGFFDVPSDYRVKTVNEMLAEVEERAVRDLERIEALEQGDLIDEPETEEMRKWRIEIERLAALEASADDELKIADDASSSSDDDDRARFRVDSSDARSRA